MPEKNCGTGNGPDDHELVARAKAGDNEAYDVLMLRHTEAIGVQMRRFSGIPDVVEELTQTVFVKAYQGLRTYEPRAPFIHWLRTIASRVGYEHWRRDARQIKWYPIHENESAAGMEAGAENQSDQEAEINRRYRELTRVMDRLKPADRQILYLLYVDDLSLKETADIMGWSASVTKMRAYRAKLKLRQLLRQEAANGTIPYKEGYDG